MNEFLDVIQKEDIRIKEITPKTYSLTELRFLSDNLMTMQEGFLLEQLFGTLDNNL